MSIKPPTDPWEKRARFDAVRDYHKNMGAVFDHEGAESIGRFHKAAASSIEYAIDLEAFVAKITDTDNDELKWLREQNAKLRLALQLHAIPHEALKP